MPTKTRDDKSLERHTGASSLLKFDSGDGYVEIPITNVSWTRDHNTNDLQHNGSMKPTITTTGVRYNGSFEYDGQNPELLDQFLQTDGSGNGSIHDGRPTRGTLTINEYNHDDTDAQEQTVTFKNVVPTSFNRDLPSDGSSSTSVDFEAEDMLITQSGFGENDE